jgi:hypothetical protein
MIVNNPCYKRSSSHFTGILRGARFFSKMFSQKSWGPFKISRETAHSVIWPGKLGIYSWLLKKFTNISLGSHNFKSIDDIFTLNFYCMWLQLSWHGHWGLIVDRSFIFADFFIRTFSSLYYIFIKTFYLAKWLERLAVNAKVATVLCLIPASSNTVESEGRQMKQCWITYI